MVQLTRALIDTGGATTFEALNMTTDLFSTFPSGILHFPLVAPPDLILNHLSTIQILNHANHEPGYKKP
jgi:hypothetical protein